MERAETASPETAVASAQIGVRPEADRLARAVARTRIGNKLFAKDEQVRLGRYQLLEMVGAGGMGVVWGAWDPELERRVAIKLVKATIPAARERIQLEGQALARLSHPNVVTVHDVGVVDEQIYIVMEWVRGQNLRAYCREPRTVREIVALYRAAGDGLAAAHAAGLIHRDFKPDNAIRGDDGRVRVLDFGLARDELRSADGGEVEGSALTRGAGTPRYMPPEQAEGRALIPAVDQYAFCVSLREALAGRNAGGVDADIPGWIQTIVARGTARDPGARFRSMAELLRALARDPATIWRRRLIVGGAVAAAAAAFVIGSLRASGGAIEPCTGAREEIARTWSPAARAQMAAHL
ncbi:MAG TPA: serine/threonine-protein kinase, partial [Kofleriaceae bacterium]